MTNQPSKENMANFVCSKKGFSIKNATKEQLEETARTCEKFIEIFPVLFPYTHITHKMHVLSIVAPVQIRRQGSVYKMLKYFKMLRDILY